MKNFGVRLPRDLLDSMRSHLLLPHEFALERVGFAFGRTASTRHGEIVILSQFLPVADAHYEEDASVGARIGQLAITASLQHALKERAATFHVHLHNHEGTPWFSGIDLRQLPPIMKPFLGLVPTQPHGLLLLSRDECIALAGRQGDHVPRATRMVTVVGDALAMLGRGRP